MPQDSKPTRRRITKADFDGIVELVCDEHSRRKRNRGDTEKHWKEIDRQVAMIPNNELKKLPNGQIDPGKHWMAEIEPPLQAQALEVLTADARRFMFPTPPWFRAHAETTDAYLKRMDGKSIILGDQNDVPSLIDQDNADKLVEGFVLHGQRQYDFFERYDRINAEAFKYGMGVGRGRMQTKSVFIHQAKGTVRENQKIPVIVPCSIKNLYLDDPMPSMHTVQALEPAHIAEDWVKLEALRRAAGLGSSDPDDEDGGWMQSAVNSLEPGKDGYVQILEIEGDLVIPRKTVRNIVARGVIATVAVGGKKGDKNTKALIRLRFRKAPMSSYLLHPYHYECSDDIYPTSPLMKGRPVQIMVADAINRLMDAAALKNQPPVGYDRNDQEFVAEGGPQIFPGSQWGTVEEIKVYKEVGGDPAAMSRVLSLAINFYAELTGILPARLGAQTVSHTTAFAKDAELTRGAVRTIDYVQQAGAGPVTRWLDMAYRMGRSTLTSSETIKFFIDAYDGFVEVSRGDLPEHASFEWFGSGGPAEEQAVRNARMQSAQMALQLDQIGAQFGKQPTVDYEAMIRQVLREGKWSDVDAITRLNDAVQAPQSVPTGQLGVLTEAAE